MVSPHLRKQLALRSGKRLLLLRPRAPAQTTVYESTTMPPAVE